MVGRIRRYGFKKIPKQWYIISLDREFFLRTPWNFHKFLLVDVIVVVVRLLRITCRVVCSISSVYPCVLPHRTLHIHESHDEFSSVTLMNRCEAMSLAIKQPYFTKYFSRFKIARFKIGYIYIYIPNFEASYFESRNIYIYIWRCLWSSSYCPHPHQIKWNNIINYR